MEFFIIHIQILITQMKLWTNSELSLDTLGVRVKGQNMASRSKTRPSFDHIKIKCIGYLKYLTAFKKSSN